MSQHPLNLGIRFFLEIVALIAIGIWGYQKPEGNVRFLLVIILPLIASVLWGVFRVPNDPGVPPVQVSGLVRLMLEWSVFATAAILLSDVGFQRLSLLLAFVTMLHYTFSYDRILWLLKQ